jgi:hypothetical protein
VIDLAALTYVAVATIVLGAIVGAWSREPVPRQIGELVAVFGIAMLGAAGSRWWGSAELEAAALVVFAVVALRSGLGEGEGA